jgi:hypothetical protein
MAMTHVSVDVVARRPDRVATLVRAKDLVRSAYKRESLHRLTLEYIQKTRSDLVEGMLPTLIKACINRFRLLRLYPLSGGSEVMVAVVVEGRR